MKLKLQENGFAQFLHTAALYTLVIASAGFATGHISTHAALAVGLVATTVAVLSTQTMLER